MIQPVELTSSFPVALSNKTIATPPVCGIYCRQAEMDEPEAFKIKSR